jgi:membrane protein
MKKIKQYISRMIRIINKKELGVLPGQIAYFLVLSMIPLLTLIGVIASKFSISMESLTDAVKGAFPKAIIDILLPALISPGFGVGMSMLLGFVVASNGTTSIIVASNMLFKIEGAGYLKNRIKAIFMLLVLISLFFFVVVVMAFGNNLLLFLYHIAFDSKMPELIYNIFLVLKWTSGILVIFIMIKLLFTMAPDAAISSKYMNKGAVFTTVAWLISTSVYSIYANNFANYNIFYSSLASIVVLMIWVYILSYSLVIGIAMNSDDYLREMHELKQNSEV